MREAANGIRAMPMRNKMFTHTRARFTRNTKWNTWWFANQYTPRTMKLMKNVANRDQSATRPPAKPPLLGVADEPSRRHVVLRVSEERTPQRRGHCAQRDEREEPDRLPVRTLHRDPEFRARGYLLRVRLERAVGSTGFEPVTFAMSRRCHSH